MANLWHKGLGLAEIQQGLSPQETIHTVKHGDDRIMLISRVGLLVAFFTQSLSSLGRVMAMPYFYHF